MRFHQRLSNARGVEGTGEGQKANNEAYDKGYPGPSLVFLSASLQLPLATHAVPAPSSPPLWLSLCLSTAPGFLCLCYRCVLLLLLLVLLLLLLFALLAHVVPFPATLNFSGQRPFRAKYLHASHPLQCLPRGIYSVK